MIMYKFTYKQIEQDLKDGKDIFVALIIINRDFSRFTRILKPVRIVDIKGKKLITSKGKVLNKENRFEVSNSYEEIVNIFNSQIADIEEVHKKKIISMQQKLEKTQKMKINIREIKFKKILKQTKKK